MKWFCYPVAVVAALLGTTAFGANFARYGRISNDEVETSPAQVDAAHPVMHDNHVHNPAPAGNCGCGPTATCGTAGCGTRRCASGGFMGLSWATGCCPTQSNCCSSIWDGFCDQNRSWCSRSRGCDSCNSCDRGCGRARGCGSACGTNWDACFAMPNCFAGNACGGCNPCGGFRHLGGYGCGGCGTSCGVGCGSSFGRVRGFARDCWSSVCGGDYGVVNGGCSTGACGCAAGAAPAMNAPQHDVHHHDAAPAPLHPTPAIESPIPQVEPQAEPLPQGTGVQPKATGKTAQRSTAPRSWSMFSAFPSGL